MDDTAEPAPDQSNKTTEKRRRAKSEAAPTVPEALIIFKHTGVFKTWVYQYTVKQQINLVVDLLRAAARGATSGKTVTSYLSGVGRPDFQYMVVGSLRGPWPRARPPCMTKP